MWSLVWGQKLFLALVVPCAGPKLLVWLLRRCWQTDKSRWGGKLWKMLYPSWKAAVSVHFWEPPVAGPSVLSLLATFQVTKPGRSRWPRCCGCALPCLPRNATARNPTFLPAYLWSTFLNSLSTLGVFPDGCLYLFFLSLPFSLGWWQQRWAKITLGLIIGWSCKTGFLQVFERWAALSHSLS